MKEKRENFIFEVRAERKEDGPAHLIGYAAKFDQFSEDLGGFVEKIAPGAFSKAIVDDDVRALFNHDANIILGRNRAGTLVLTEDETGLRIDITPPDTQLVRDMVVSPIERRDITQMSFGFETLEDSWAWDKQPCERTLLSVRLYDVSPVVFPAYRQTEIALRSLEQAKKAAQGGEDTPPNSARIREILNLHAQAAAVIL